MGHVNDIKAMGQYLLKLVLLTSRDKKLNCVFCETVHQTSLRESAVGAGRRPLTPLGISGGPYHVITVFFIIAMLYVKTNHSIWHWG